MGDDDSWTTTFRHSLVVSDSDACGGVKARLVIVRFYSFGCVLAKDADFSASRDISQRPLDRHRASECRVFRLEFDQLDDPLVRNQFQESRSDHVAVVRRRFAAG